jgi:hypothetical protein
VDADEDKGYDAKAKKGPKTKKIKKAGTMLLSFSDDGP